MTYKSSSFLAVFLLLAQLGCGSTANSSGPDKGGGAPTPGEVYAAERNTAIEEDLQEWYSQAGISEEDLTAMDTVINDYFSDFLDTPPTQADPLVEPGTELVKQKFRQLYGQNHSAEAEFLDWYDRMMEDRYVYEESYLSGEEFPVEGGGTVVFTWEVYLGSLEYVLKEYTEEIKSILSADDFQIGFGRLGSEGNLFSVLKLEKDTPLIPSDEKDYFINNYDLIPQCAFVENCLPTEVRQYWDQLLEQEGE